jgi:hypothetical protein
MPVVPEPNFFVLPHHSIDQQNLSNHLELSSTQLASETDGQDGTAAAAVAAVDEDEAMAMKVIDDVPGSLHGACQHYKYIMDNHDIVYNHDIVFPEYSRDYERYSRKCIRLTGFLNDPDP